MARLSERGLRASVGIVGDVRDGLRQRRLLDLLRARARRRARAGAHAARVPVRGRPVRADRQNVRRGRLDVPRSGRLLVVRAPRLRRRRLVLRRLGAEPRLHPHDRDLRVLRAALPERVPRAGRAQAQPGRHLRRPDRGRRAGLAEHPRAGRVGEAQPRPRGRWTCRTQIMLVVHRHRARPEPVAADPPGAPGLGADVEGTDLRAVAGDARLHGHRDRREHGRGVQGPGQAGAEGGEPRRARRARRSTRASRSSRSRRCRSLHHGVGYSAELKQSFTKPRVCDLAGRLLRKRPDARRDRTPRAAWHGPETGQILPRVPRRDDPVHRDQRRDDRDLAPVLVAVRAPPAAAAVLAGCTPATARRGSR